MRHSTPAEPSLDPPDWDEYRALGHAIIDDTVDDLIRLPARRAWTPMSPADQAPFRSPPPRRGKGIRGAYRDFVRLAKPFPFGQYSPRFWGWAGGTGTAEGIYAKLLEGAFQSPVIIHHHAGMWIEIQVLEWLRQVMGFPAGTKGNLTSGGSMANFTGLAVARHVKGGAAIRRRGVGAKRLAVYGSAATHYSAAKALDLLGLGSDAFREVPVTEAFEIDLDALDRMVTRDRRQGWKPIAVVGNAGTVGTGAIDPLDALADFAERKKLWFHIDGAFGAIAAFSSRHRGLVAGMERADSLAFDLHKWLSQPYDAGCVLVRDGDALEATFRFGAAYTTAVPGSVTDVPVVFSNRGPELSRTLRGLPFWISMKTHGAAAFGTMVDKNIAQARYLEKLVQASPVLELLVTGPLPVVNFRYVGRGRRTLASLNALNRRLLGAIQARGIAIPSLYAINDQAAIRVCNLNQRSQRSDLEALVRAAETIGAELEGGSPDRQRRPPAKRHQIRR